MQTKRRIFIPSVLAKISTCLLVLLTSTAHAQVDPDFFPTFEAYANNPVIKYGDGFADAAWGDPCVIKHNGEYVMYATAAEGIFISETNTVKVYRHISEDGYNWTLSPETAVLQPLNGTYYEGGTETPTVVVKDGTFHMYLTCYPPGNNEEEYTLGHATSSDGINWTMDEEPVLELNPGTFYGTLIGEPGAALYQNNIHLFFTAAGIVDGTTIQSIGWMTSSDGTNFSEPETAIGLPEDVYPIAENYWGLSTPSALAVNDTLYLFTDVAQTINDNWTQVALHQFKKDNLSDTWYHDDVPIHTMSDFEWTDGDYLSNLLAITPLLEEDGRLRIWYSGQRIADINGVDTTYHVTFDENGVLHVDPDYWGIGTSEYLFPNFNSIAELNENDLEIELFPNPGSDNFVLRCSAVLKDALIQVRDISGKQILSITSVCGSNIPLSLAELDSGIYLLQIRSKMGNYAEKLVITD
jgi:hypothetical protein